jgi:inorganic pyrophosphatase
MLKMTDEAGEDTKLLAVPIDKVCTLYTEVKEPADVAPLVLAQVAHFFEHYKDLEPGKWVRIDGWEGAAAAKAEIKAGVRRFDEAKSKPAF